MKAVIEASFRRRRFALTVEQLGLAVTLVCCGAVLMLLLGTQILDWYWLVLLLAVGLSLVVIRVRLQAVSRYRVAQLVDRRLEFKDSLSTAWFLLNEPEQAENAVAQIHIQRADELAKTVQPAYVFPIAGQRAWVLAAALATVVFGLFALRYLVTDSLSLKRALIPLSFSSSAELLERLEKPFTSEKRQLDRSSLKMAGLPPGARTNGTEEKGDALDKTPEGIVPGQPNGSASNGNASELSLAKQNGGSQDGKVGEPTSDAAAQRNGSAANAKSEGDTPGDKQASAQKEKAEANRQEASPGLMDRMKDALSRVMENMRPKGGEQHDSDKGNAAGDQKAGGHVDPANAHEAKQEQGSPNQKSEQAQNSGAQTQGQASEKAQSSQANSSDSSDKKGSDAHSGVGRQDGDKSLAESEQLRAMGKLAEIIGKRSASVTGDMTVETPSGHQQLKTQYSGRLGHHMDLGGEIKRDEIPVELQPYVREYMEEVRKQAKNQ